MKKFFILLLIISLPIFPRSSVIKAKFGAIGDNGFMCLIIPKKASFKDLLTVICKIDNIEIRRKGILLDEGASSKNLIIYFDGISIFKEFQKISKSLETPSEFTKKASWSILKN